MKKLGKWILILILFLTSFPTGMEAKTKTIYVKLDSLEYSTNQKNYESIPTYHSVEELIQEISSNTLPDIYVTDFLYDGVSSVKSPDLDDFLESESNDISLKTLELTVLNIHTTGNIQLTGTLQGGMIALNANDLKGEVNLLLNGVEIDTDTKKSPAIYVYHKDKNNTDCKVTIQALKNTTNTIEGGKLKKVSLMPSDELENYEKYYSNENLTNYQKYSSYYGIYTKEELDHILFATVYADREDLQDGDPYAFYKASGAISSDIDLYFEGEGTLKVISKNKEGIETKGNLTFSGGIGDYEIYAEDDCLNTTTAKNGNDTVRNDLTINVHSLLAVVSEDADEGDAIDSNGKLIIEGGTIYAFAHPTSGDAGLDSEDGTYIQGGTIIATGNMVDAISKDSKQNYIYARFSKKIDKDTLIVLKDQKDNIITAFQTGRTISNLLYSSPNLNTTSYQVYTGGTIQGDETNGLYTKIDSYEGGEEISYQDMSQLSTTSNSNSSLWILLSLGIEIVLLFSLVLYYIKKNSGTKEKD